MFGIRRLRHWMAQKANSDWIYTNKWQQMNHIHKGKIYVVSDVGLDTHNCTLRMHKAYMDSFLVFTPNPIHTTAFLEAIANKTRYVSSSSLTCENTSIVQHSFDQIQPYTKDQYNAILYEWEIQKSKHIQFEQQIQKIDKSNNDKDNKILYEHQKQLNEFMKVNTMKESLHNLREERGYPRVLDLKHLEQVRELHKSGVNVTIVLNQMGIDETKRVLDYLQGLPYEMLPAPNNLLNMTVATGFPADRFAIQYFPKDIVSTLQKRKSLKLTVNIIVESQKRFEVIDAIKEVYGDCHMLYIDIGLGQQTPQFFRGNAQDSLIYLQKTQCNNTLVAVSIAPFLSDFNDDLFQDKNKKSRLYGEAMANANNIVELQLLVKEISKLEEKQSVFNIRTNQLIEKLLNKMDSKDVLKVVKNLLNLPEALLMNRIQQIQSQTRDPLGIKDMYK